MEIIKILMTIMCIAATAIGVYGQFKGLKFEPLNVSIWALVALIWVWM